MPKGPKKGPMAPPLLPKMLPILAMNILNFSPKVGLSRAFPPTAARYSIRTISGITGGSPESMDPIVITSFHHLYRRPKTPKFRGNSQKYESIFLSLLNRLARRGDLGHGPSPLRLD